MAAANFRPARMLRLQKRLPSAGAGFAILLLVHPFNYSIIMGNIRKQTGAPQTMRNIFGIIMIIVYIGMGILCFCGVFDWLTGSWAWLRWVAGALFVVYGVWRAYRQFAGIDDPYASSGDDD